MCLAGHIIGLCPIPTPQELRKTILITMELCDYDLDSLVKNSPLQQDEVVTFLYHLGKACLCVCLHHVL